MDIGRSKETLLNETESASFLKVSRMTIIRRRKTGELSHYRIGFRVLYSLEKHLLPFLEKCERTLSSEATTEEKSGE